jgi:hypothetical protein
VAPARGTGTMTMPASPATDVDRPDGVPVSRPPTIRADIVAVICRVEMQAGGTLLTGMGRVDPFHRDACTLGFVGDEHGKLLERPGGHHAVVFAGVGGHTAVGPTACTCRALADASELLHANDADILLVSVGHDLIRKLVVGIAHPVSLFALALADRAHLLGLLKVFMRRAV